MLDNTEFFAMIHNLDVLSNQLDEEVKNIIVLNDGPTVDIPVSLLENIMSNLRLQCRITIQLMEQNAKITDAVEAAARKL